MARVQRSTIGRLIGLAGLAGVAAGGVVLARDERQRRAYTPDDVRARLHERAAAAAAAAAEETAAEGTAAESSLQVVPAPTTRRGKLAQRARWQLRHLPHWLQPDRRRGE